MAMRKVPVAWQTGIGGTGVSIFYGTFGSDLTVPLGTFFNAVKTNFPGAVTWDIPAAGDVIDETTGLITGAWTGGTAATIVATGAGAYVGGTGAFIRWQTAGIVAGRRVKGRTFMAPMITTNFDAQGTILAGAVTSLQSAATTLAGTGILTIWHRPSTPGGSDGSQHPVVAATVPDKVTSLRTRRT